MANGGSYASLSQCRVESQSGHEETELPSILKPFCERVCAFFLRMHHAVSGHLMSLSGVGSTVSVVNTMRLYGDAMVARYWKYMCAIESSCQRVCQTRVSWIRICQTAPEGDSPRGSIGRR
jgi:hypothetical protein